MDYLADGIVILGVATAVASLFSFVKIPATIGFIVAGMIIGPHSLGLVNSNMEIEIMAEIAASLLMFTIGLEFSFSKLAQYRKAFAYLGFGQIAITIAIVFLFCHYALGFSWSLSLVWGCLISLSSTALVLRGIKERRDQASPIGQAATSVLLFQDIAVIPMLIILPLLTAKGSHMMALSGWVLALKVFLLLPGIFVFARYIMPFVFRLVLRGSSKEVFYFFIVFFVASTAVGMHELGLSYSFGAFIAGIIVSESPYGLRAGALAETVRDNFLGLFFVAIGMLVDISFLSQNFLSVAGLGLGMIALKTTIILLLVVFLKNPMRLGLCIGLILSQVGEFSLILSGQAFRLGILDNSQNQLFLSASILTLVLTPVLFYLSPRMQWTSKISFPRLTAQADWLKGLAKARVQLDIQNMVKSEAAKKEGHVVIIGYGIAGRNLVNTLKQIEVPYEIIELNPETVRSLQGKEPIHYGDASQTEVLHTVGVERARIVVVAISDANIINRIAQAVHKMNPSIPIIIRTHYIKEIERFSENDKNEYVIGEAETALQLLARVLTEYGVNEDEVHALKKESRDTICEKARCSL
jgi:CPA2 family monovalent cation:H+ antiporter-2